MTKIGLTRPSARKIQPTPEEQIQMLLVNHGLLNSSPACQARTSR